MFFWRKNNKNSKDQPGGNGGSIPPRADNDNPSPAGQPPAADPASSPAPGGGNKKPKRSLIQAFGDGVRGLRSLTLEDLRGTAGETLKDLRKPKEVGLLIVAIIVPGGMFGWGAYRLQKFKSAKPANDNLPPPDSRKPAPPQNKSGQRKPDKKKPGKGGPKPG